MGSKKNRGNNRQSFQPPKAPQQPINNKPEAVKNTIITLSDVESSASESEFNAKKDKLIEQFIVEIDSLEQEKTNAEKAVESVRTILDELEAKRLEIQLSKDAIQAELDIVNTDLVTAQREYEEAENKARSILDNAEKEKLDIIAEAADEARSVLKQQSESLFSQISKIADREAELQRSQLQLEKDKREFEFRQEELSELQSFVMQQKEKYAQASPLKIESLSLELNEMSEKYGCLRKKLDEQTQKYVELQTLLDSIKAEIGDSSDGSRSATVNTLMLSLKELRENYDSLALLHERYPDEESIRPLEKAAGEYERLMVTFENLERECDRYREEAKSLTRTQKELETIKQEVDATNALNEHLLKELQSHKTALESRTGDTCTSLTKVDTETEDSVFVEDITNRKGRKSLSSLQDIVTHVKHYAGSRKKEEQLYYSDDDIRAFLAGMAVSRLIILQGMSGTGKSSLPRIFSEAISGFNRLIPVESSWRDRNELLGYFNDFNKKFNAKGFTIELYRSGKKSCADIPTFMVLDEMNLARIEYYFSDFLAILQEPDPSKWLIELVSSDMRTLPMELPESIKDKMRKTASSIYEIWERIEKSRRGELSAETTDEEKTELYDYLDKLGMLTGAKDLIDGRKIRVPENVWFVGTANRDESTFEISDKVYDRAQVVSLNQKGVEEKYDIKESMFISAPNLIQLFEIAKNKNGVKSEVEERLKELDDLLIDKFDVSFGNRIIRQSIDFAAVFVAAGGKLDKALDYQISTKILRKVIMSDDSEALLELQILTENYPETQRHIAKRIRELR